MLFAKRFWPGLADGTITVAFRRWARPRVRPGTRLRMASGVLAVEAVTVVDLTEISDEDVRRAGYDSRDALAAELDRYGDGPVHRVELRFAGPDPRDELRERAELGDDELAGVLARLARLDRSSRHGAWTGPVLRAIEDGPGTRAADLAARLGRDTDAFKTDVRRLKELGLTESLAVGYRLSPRGRTVLRALDS